ncbi:hypothetical protein RF11_08466 [Thelohanellus kitauei]|uniref:Reverse transcriptase domain-containing protein n=1 Tax=Thelohanellus kitauei TaxID=669202 RepID=A0A0C2I7U2_THEKT|nr:hypothetical protein RF11_08466 [Thelohanellus kitauei]
MDSINTRLESFLAEGFRISRNSHKLQRLCTIGLHRPLSSHKSKASQQKHLVCHVKQTLTPIPTFSDFDLLRPVSKEEIARTILLPKSATANPNNIDDFRPISITNTLYHIITDLFGVQRTAKCGKSVSLAYVHLTKAFDLVNHNELLTHTGLTLGRDVQQFVDSLYTNAVTYVDNDSTTQQLHYPADDILLISNSEAELQKGINLIDNWCLKYGMEINPTKCATLGFRDKICIPISVSSARQSDIFKISTSQLAPNNKLNTNKMFVLSKINYTIRLSCANITDISSFSKAFKCNIRFNYVSSVLILLSLHPCSLLQRWTWHLICKESCCNSTRLASQHHSLAKDSSLLEPTQDYLQILLLPTFKHPNSSNSTEFFESTILSAKNWGAEFIAIDNDIPTMTLPDIVLSANNSYWHNLSKARISTQHRKPPIYPLNFHMRVATNHIFMIPKTQTRRSSRGQFPRKKYNEISLTRTTVGNVQSRSQGHILNKCVILKADQTKQHDSVLRRIANKIVRTDRNSRPNQQRLSIRQEFSPRSSNNEYRYIDRLHSRCASRLC